MERFANSRRTKWAFSRLGPPVLAAGAVGIITWFFLNAAIFTPLQRYYWDEYLNTEMYQVGSGNYRVLDVVDRRGSHRIAVDSDVLPATVQGLQLVPFVLSTQ